MTGISVALSDISDGSMYNRNDHMDASVFENREKWLEKQGIKIDQATRVRVTFFEPENDYCRYVEVGPKQMGGGMLDNSIAPADALVTTTRGQALFLPIADCVATTFFDEEHEVLMLAHLGRHSLEQDGGLKCVEFLQQHYGSKPENLKVWLSPTVNQEAYPIFKLDNKGMKEAAYEQLEKAGIDFKNVIDNKDDTATNPNYYSYSEFLKGHKSEDGDYAMVAMMLSEK